MAIYEPQDELLVVPNRPFGDPLLGPKLSALELRSAFAAEPDPGSSRPRPREPAITSSNSVPPIVEDAQRRAGFEAPRLIAILLDTKLRPLHVVDGPPAYTAEEAHAAAVDTQRLGVLGGATQCLIVRYEAKPRGNLGWESALHEDPVLAELATRQRRQVLAVELLDYVWVDPDSGAALGAHDIGAF